MLNCVYHPIDSMRIVDDEERERLISSGFWFDSPKEAKEMRNYHEEKILNDKKNGKKKVIKEINNENEK